MMAPRTWVILGAAAAAGVALYVWRKGGIANAAASVTTAAADAGAGVVLGLGDAMGVPRTETNRCAELMREGRWWDASFACPAGTLLSGAWGAATAPAVNPAVLDANDARARRGTPQTVDAAIMDANDARARRGTGAGSNTSEPPPYWDVNAINGEGSFWPMP
jgi:hypothetical protein